MRICAIWCGSVRYMAAPAQGLDRLIYYMDQRIAQLNLSKDEIARRGGPSRDTLAKVRGRANGRTPMVSTLLRLDQSLGWQPGSSAVVMQGGEPLTVTATARATRKANREVDPVTGREVVHRITAQLHDEIVRLEGDRDTLDLRIARLRQVHDHLVAEFTIDPKLLEAYTTVTPRTSRRATG
uniref:Uncharacterized protein n=2 Tax=Mycolicibacterium TaxID=1866885 RepID=A0A1S6GKQ8_9MYCO|nr:hypothetical protein pCBMA213_2_00095 [Mycolicibacterium sp. CBMA 213]